MNQYSLVHSSNTSIGKWKMESHHVDEQKLDQILKAFAEDTSLNKELVSDSLSKFLDEANVSMMGGWT